jgi:Calcineurin-like phosphoesterase
MTDNNLNIQVPKDVEIAVVGDIHGHPEQFFKLIDTVKPSEKRLFVSVGDLVDKGYGEKAEIKIMSKMRELCDQKIGFIVQANHEWKHIRRYKNKDKMPDHIKWAATWPFSLSFVFSSQLRLTIVHGGVKPTHTWQDLESNTDLLYIRQLDENNDIIPLHLLKRQDGSRMYIQERPGTLWHELYDGRFGYIASGHDAQKDGIAKFYKHSCNLDSSCYSTGILNCQIFSERGRGELIKITGPAAHPGS